MKYLLLVLSMLIIFVLVYPPPKNTKEWDIYIVRNYEMERRLYYLTKKVENQNHYLEIVAEQISWQHYLKTQHFKHY